MSGECTVTPGHAWPDGDKISLAKLRLTAQPAVQVNANSIGSRELNASELVGVIGDSIINTNFLRHGNFDEPSWRRAGAGPQSAPAGAETRLHEDWFTLPLGAAVTIERSTTVPVNNLSLHAYKITGATSATTVDLGQDIKRHVSEGLRTNLTFSAWIYNGTGADITTAKVRLDTADAANSFTGVTNRAEAALQTCANAQWTQVSATIDASGLTNMTNGLRVVLRFPSGSLNAASKSVVVSQVKLEKGTVVTPFAILPDPDDPLVPNRNVLQNGNFPAPAWLGNGSPTSSPAATDTELCRGWMVKPSGAAITQERAELAPDAHSIFALKLTGAASVTTVDLSQNMLRYLAAELRQSITFSCYIRNVTTAAFVPQLVISTADAADVFTAVTARLTQNLDSCAIATWTRVQWTFDPTAYTNIANGLRLTMRLPSGVFASGSDVVYIAQCKLERGSNRTELLPERVSETSRLTLKWRTRNLMVVNNATTPNSKLDITADEVVLSDSNNGQIFADTVSVSADIAVSGANGLDTGSEASSTWYYLWLISNGATVASLLSASATSPTLPSGYSFSARIGVVRNDGSSNFIRLVQRDQRVAIVPQVVFNGLAASALDTYQAASLSGLVPSIASEARGTFGPNVTAYNTAAAVAADANGTGACVVVGSFSSTAEDTFNGARPWRVQLSTTSVYWKTNYFYSSTVWRMVVNGYDL